MTIDEIIEETKRDIIRMLREERFVEIIGKIGFIGTMGSLTVISIVAICAILIRFQHMEHIILSVVSLYGPGIATAFGTVSSAVTYYGWSRILRRKKKLSAKEEGESEAQNQLGDFIQSIPDMLGTLSGGCFSQASTAVLGASIAMSTVAYVPAVNEVFNKAVNSVERAVVSTIKQYADKPSEEQAIEKEQITEAEEKIEETAEKAEKQHIFGKLDLRGGAGKKERTRVELMSSNKVVDWVFADSEGNYAFYVTPGDYTVQIRLDGYESVHTTDFKLSSKNMRISKITLNSISEAKPIKAKPKSPVHPTPIIQPKSKAPPSEQSLPSEPPPLPPPPPSKTKQRQQQEPAPLKSEAPKSGFFAGAGSELNNNSARKGSTAMGGNVVLGYDLNRSFALGLNTIYSHDMNTVSTLESMLMFRYYLPVTGYFLQAEAGGALSAADGKNSAIPLGGLTAGLRLEVDKSWYLEPTLRGGYPFIWGPGITLGKKVGR
jgi:hypothetical protein